MKKIFFILITFFLISSCVMTKKNEPALNYLPGPKAIVYKTKKDYSKNVPVILSDDKTKIVTYFGQSDMTYKGVIAYPTVLDDGYLLDNIGIGKNVAYTSLTIEAYKTSDKNYSADELFKLIIDKDPIKVMYNCGNRTNFTNEVEEINLLIKDKQLKKKKKIK